MLIYHRTNIMESTTQTVVNTVNCVGVMGKGLASAFKKRHPDMFQSYKKICDQKLLEPGKLWVWRGAKQWVLNFPTKKHWKSPSKLEWIEQGLAKFVDRYEEQGITEISFPKLGCGNGNLDWEDVRPMMEHYLSKVSIDVYIHDHHVDIGLPEHLEELTRVRGARGMSLNEVGAWNSLSDIVDRFGDRLVDFESNEPFRASHSGDALLVEYGNHRTFLGSDEVAAMWRIATDGLLTKRKIGLADEDEASRLISLFSLIPGVQPVQIGVGSPTNLQVAASIQRTIGSDDAPTDRTLFAN